jgi:hypothetical protein
MINKSLFDESKRLIEAQKVIRIQAIEAEVMDEQLKAERIKTIKLQAYADDAQLYYDFKQQEKAIDEQSAASRIEIAQMVAGSITGIAAGLEATGLVSARKAFNINKAASASDATVNGILAVQKALASAPTPYNYVLAGIVGASAAGNVAKILATPFGGGGGGSQTSPSGSIASSAPSPAVGLSIQNVAAGAVASSAVPMAGSSAPTIIVTNNIDRAGIATLVREGNDEISSRGIAVTSAQAT